MTGFETVLVRVAGAAGDAFAALGPLDTDTLFTADLDPDTLAATMPPAPPGPGEAAEALYGRLVRRTGRLERHMDRMAARPAPSAESEAHRF
ncbi:NACHT N-terminal Helical domain 1-containing protein [Streptomyces yangpuensis]